MNYDFEKALIIAKKEFADKLWTPIFYLYSGLSYWQFSQSPIEKFF
ncbi:MAG TPA: hypothetical protein HA261_14845 [Methanosarcina sp.]|nr:hypothetical protein [Methanosarcina sp.]